MRSVRTGIGRLAVGIALVAAGAAGGVRAADAQESTGAPARSSAETAVVTGTVHGRLGARRVPLAHARLTVPGGPSVAAAVSDGEGRYTISGVAPGDRTLRVSRLGYRPLAVEIAVPPGGTVHLDLDVEAAPIAVAGITVRPDLLVEPVRMATDVTEAEVRLGILELGPGGAGAGLAGAARALAGGGSGPGGRRLLMRGSVADQKRVLLDGVPVHAPFHLGGLLPGVEAELFAGARHHVGAAPASYPGGLSHVLDLSTRPPATDEVRGRAAADLATASASVEGPLGDAASALLAARSLHGLGTELLGDGALPYGYEEVLVRLRARPHERHRLDATGFFNRESVRLDFSEADPSTAVRGVGDEARWQNAAASLRWAVRTGESRLRLAVGGARYDAVLPLGRSTPAWARGTTERVRADFDGTTPAGEWTLQWGGQAETLRHRSSARSLGGDGKNAVRQAAGGTVLGAFVEGRRPLGSDVTVEVGLRADRFSRDRPPVRLAPRVRAHWLLTEEAVLSLGLGRHYQFVQPADLEVQMALGDPAGTRAGQALYPVAGADHFVLSLEQQMSPEIFFGVEGFMKAFDGLPGVADGVLRSSGVDLRVRRRGDEVSGWLGYSLAWFWSPSGQPTGADGDAFTGRHLLSAGLDGKLGDRFGGEIRLAYGDGLPFTSVPIFGDQATAPDSDQEDGTRGGGPGEPTTDSGGSEPDPVAPTLDGFLRLDVELDAEWETDFAGVPSTVRPYLRILNALDRRDALFYYFEPWRSPEARPLARRPLLPLLGVEVRF